MDDKQWPTPISPPAEFQRQPASNHEVRNRIETTESWFKQQTGFESVLFSSGRAAISTILAAHKFDRSHTIFGPKWSSFCLWETICRVANPSTDFYKGLDAAVIVHKWGKIETVGTEFAGLIIEDSVDNIVDTKTNNFPNNGKFEVISFPKVMASKCGGVVLTRDSAAAAKIRELRKDNTTDVIKSAELKLSPLNPAVKWQDIEYRVNGLEINMLNEIESTLSNLTVNQKIIAKRISQLNETTLRRFLPSERSRRSPPLIAIPQKYFRSMPASAQARNLNTAAFACKPVFEPAFLLPIHFGIDERDFQSSLKAFLKPGVLVDKTP